MIAGDGPSASEAGVGSQLQPGPRELQPASVLSAGARTQQALYPVSIYALEPARCAMLLVPWRVGLRCGWGLATWTGAHIAMRTAMSSSHAHHERLIAYVRKRARDSNSSAVA